MWIRTDKDRKKELEENLLNIIDDLRKNIVPVDVLIERTIIETNNSKKNLDDFCYEETLNFLKEEISLKENQDNKEKYKPLNLEEIITENKFVNYFDNALDKGIDYYKSAVEGIESNDQSYMFEKIRYTVDEEEQKKERNSKEKFAFYLKNSIELTIKDSFDWGNNKGKELNYNEIYLPELKKIANEISYIFNFEEKTRNRLYSVEEIEKDFDELEKGKATIKNEIEY
jgi:hypothetical protein